MKNKNMNFIVMSFLTVMFALGAGSAFSVSAASKPDLSVQIQGPSTASVNSPYVYTVKVSNIGNKNAANVTVSVEFPLTNTSPQKFILGNLSGIANGCQKILNKLECNLGTINKNNNKSFTFNFAIPVSTQPPQIKATAATTTSETNLSNNTVTRVQNLGYISNQIISANVLNSHCTGQNLSSYFECELFPSSISSHSTSLLTGGSVDVGVPGYTGIWYQSSPQQLYFNYRDPNNNIVAEFNGYASSATCFEGITTFPQNTAYNSAYKVCIQ